uniref:Elongation factor EFG domain-containing protein n=1 Tax=Aegilops tauschii subsp. strangulata TaxID=200361 RepID=A0A452XQR9_AEGTS
MSLANGMKQQPMFMEFVLKRLWKVYDHGLKVDGASWLHDHVVQTFNLKVSERELQSRDRPKAALEAVMRAWLPLAETVMTMIVECTPDPVAAQGFRAPALMPEKELPTWVSAEHAGIVAEAEKVRRCVVACSASSSDPVVVFVSKMFVVKQKDLPPTLNHVQEAAGEPEECFLAFARVFSGVLHAGQKVFVLSPMYDPVKGDTTGKHLKEVEVQQLYEMLGEGLRPVASVDTGNVAAIKGLGEHIMKTATLSSMRNCWPFASMAFQVHLEHCVKNLRERFAKVELNVSEPLVSFKETIQGEGAGLIDSLKDPQGYVERIAPDGKFAVRVKVIRLPDALVKVLEENEELLSRTIKGQTTRSVGAIGSQCPWDDDGRSVAVLRQDMLTAVESELEALSAREDEVKLESYRKALLGYLHKIWALGPSQVGPNLLLMPGVKLSSGLTTIQNRREGILVRGRCHVSEKLGFVSVSDDAEISNGIIDDSGPSTDVPDPEALRNIIISGFQQVTNAGPLCDEPMWGLAFIVEPYIFSGSPDSVNCSYQHKAAVREACRAAVLQSKPRLVEPMYFCEVTTPIERLGSVYSVLGDCRAKVQEAEMQLETFLYMVHAHLPVAESSEFSEKLWNGSSGAATARLTFSHWEAIPQDPFFVPKTKEEIEEFGDGSNMGPNLAKKLIDSVRRRKGLHVDDKVVKHGTKQRTRAKKV